MIEDNVRNVNKFRGYFLEDCECIYCVNFRGKKRGCKFKKCLFEAEKHDAIKHGRIKRKRGWDKWGDS
jgi:hypothetical protein